MFIKPADIKAVIKELIILKNSDCLVCTSIPTQNVKVGGNVKLQLIKEEHLFLPVPLCLEHMIFVTRGVSRVCKTLHLFVPWQV